MFFSVALDEGDIVFLCSDGISDNFDPAVAKFVPRFKILEFSANNNSNVNDTSPSCSPKQPSKNTCKHQNSSDISEGDTMFKKLEDEESPLPNEVIYFEFDDSNPEKVVESSVAHNYYTTHNSMNTTVHSSNENSHDKNSSTTNQEIHNVHNIKANSNMACKSTNNSVESNVNTTCNVIQQENNINSTGIGKDIENMKDTMCSDGICLTPRERHEGALEQMKEVILYLFY